ncbi:MAG: NAD(P)H-quinone oxidoreductase [Propionibacteriaceae bacterium]|jgi:putative PIG3 family NAD(P)H quinone oxidoreductase|nr:NAD(P)H-quinone oxidoreductase [Propionibacteriaceae bacterium]
MRAITVLEPGGPEVMVLGEVPDPQPAVGEVLISVQASGVNRADILQRRGYYPPPQGISEIIGLEVAGVVEAANGTTAFKPGDTVIALLAGGGYAEKAVAPAGQCAPIPAGLDMIQAAAIMETAATVASNFDHINLVPGETILIHGGAGGVGTFAIPYAKYIGLTVVTTVGSETKAEFVRGLGADVTIDYHGDWATEVLHATDGRGVDAILDIMGAKYLEANVALLARGGRMTVIGLQGGTKGTLDLNRLLSKAATVTATSLRFRPVPEKVKIVSEVIARIWPLFEAGTIPLPPMTTFPLANAAAAHAHLDSGANVGKVVLTAQ